MKKFVPLIVSGVLLLGTVACNNIARTSQDAPNKVGVTTKTPSASEVQDTQTDAQSQVRRNQLNADIRARNVTMSLIMEVGSEPMAIWKAKSAIN